MRQLKQQSTHTHENIAKSSASKKSMGIDGHYCGVSADVGNNYIYELFTRRLPEKN